MIQSRKTYRIEGLSCANCAGKFERNVRGLASVEEAQVNFGA
ncbi:heavy-metal-associated domain-containing protein, partial [Staphylococcus pseudintermedius]